MYDWYAFPVSSQGSCLQNEERLSLQINLSARGDQPADLDKLKPYIIEHILFVLIAPNVGPASHGGFPRPLVVESKWTHRVSGVNGLFDDLKLCFSMKIQTFKKYFFQPQVTLSCSQHLVYNKKNHHHWISKYFVCFFVPGLCAFLINLYFIWQQMQK